MRIISLQGCDSFWGRIYYFNIDRYRRSKDKRWILYLVFICYCEVIYIDSVGFGGEYARGELAVYYSLKAVVGVFYEMTQRPYV